MSYIVFILGASSFSEAMRMGSEIYHHLKKIIKEKFGLDSTAVGDEGGFAPNIQNNKDALFLIQDAIKQAGYTGKVSFELRHKKTWNKYYYISYFNITTAAFVLLDVLYFI